MINFKISYDIDKLGKEAPAKVKRVLMKSMFKMEELAVFYAPYNLGFLRNNINLFPQILSDKYELKSNAKHSSAMEYGTRPFYAPIAPLKKWASQKIGDEKVAYAVQKSIAKKGIKAHPFMRPALLQVESYWVKEFAKDEFSRNK